jgi:hypothetical protein
MQEPRRAAYLEGSLLLRAEPLRLAEQVCRRLVGDVRITNDVLWLDADPAWSGALNTVLVKKGVRVSELIRHSHCGSAPLLR